MGLCELMTTARKLEPTEMISRATTEAQQVAMQPIPKANATVVRETSGKFKCQRPVAGTRDVLAELFFVRREDANTTSAARDGHVPLLRVRRCLDR
jgi:hypothetical protein